MSLLYFPSVPILFYIKRDKSLPLEDYEERLFTKEKVVKSLISYYKANGLATREIAKYFFSACLRYNTLQAYKESGWPDYSRLVLTREPLFSRKELDKLIKTYDVNLKEVLTACLNNYLNNNAIYLLSVIGKIDNISLPTFNIRALSKFYTYVLKNFSLTPIRLEKLVKEVVRQNALSLMEVMIDNKIVGYDSLLSLLIVREGSAEMEELYWPVTYKKKVLSTYEPKIKKNTFLKMGSFTPPSKDRYLFI